MPHRCHPRGPSSTIAGPNQIFPPGSSIEGGQHPFRRAPFSDSEPVQIANWTVSESLPGFTGGFPFAASNPQGRKLAVQSLASVSTSSPRLPKYPIAEAQMKTRGRDCVLRQCLCQIFVPSTRLSRMVSFSCRSIVPNALACQVDDSFESRQRPPELKAVADPTKICRPPRRSAHQPNDPRSLPIPDTEASPTPIGPETPLTRTALQSASPVGTLQRLRHLLYRL